MAYLHERHSLWLETATTLLDAVRPNGYNRRSRWASECNHLRDLGYKKYRLGYVSPTEMLIHNISGVSAHAWMFESQRGAEVEQVCYICGKSRRVDRKGRVIYK
jgi:hypothetical protein